MTLNQLETLSEGELALAVYIVNVVSPPGLPKITFEPRHLTWFNHEMFIKKLLDVFPKLDVEGHATYVSLMQKLGVCIVIQNHPNPNLNETESTKNEAATETTKSAGCPQTSSIQPDVSNVTGSNAAG